MNDMELYKLALEALEWEWGGEPLGTLTLSAITALKKRIEIGEAHAKKMAELDAIIGEIPDNPEPVAEPLKLADALMEAVVLDKHMMQASAALRRLHWENLALKAAVKRTESQEYAKQNPLGGPAKVFDAMADAIRAGDDYHATLRRYGFAALAEPQGEPVAWMVYTADGQSVYVTDNPTQIGAAERALPLYTHPASDHTTLLREARDALSELLYAWNDKSESKAIPVLARLDAALGDT